MIDVVLF